MHVKNVKQGLNRSREIVAFFAVMEMFHVRQFNKIKIAVNNVFCCFTCSVRLAASQAYSVAFSNKQPV